MAKAKRKNTMSRKATAKPAVLTKDQKITQACVHCGVMIGTINGAFKIDPDPNNENAAAATDAYYKERDSALRTASAKAETIESINAKARVLSLLLEQSSDGSLDEVETTFAAAFARDVEAITSKLMDEARKRAHQTQAAQS